MWKHIAALYVPYQTFSLDKEENLNKMKDENHGKQSDHGLRCDRLLPFKSLTEVDHNLSMVWDVTDYYPSNHWQR